MDPTLYAVVYGCLVLYEIADKAVDLVITIRYDEGRISSNPQDSVYYALVTFLTTGFLITSLRVILYIRTIKLPSGDDDDQEATRDAINLWISLSKSLFEAFPQMTIALVTVHKQAISRPWFKPLMSSRCFRSSCSSAILFTTTVRKTKLIDLRR